MTLKDKINHLGLKQKFLGEKFGTTESVVSTLVNNEVAIYKILSYVEDRYEADASE